MDAGCAGGVPRAVRPAGAGVVPGASSPTAGSTLLRAAELPLQVLGLRLGAGLARPGACTLLFVALAVLALLIAAGPVLPGGDRACSSSLFTYVQLLDVTQLPEPLLPGQPAGAAAGVHARARRAARSTRWLRPALRRATRARAGASTLLRFQVGRGLHLSPGWPSCSADWLLHAQPLSIWLRVAHRPAAARAAAGAAVAVALVTSWAGFLFDTTHRRCSCSGGAPAPFAYVAVLVFHALTGLLFPDRHVPGDHDRRGARCSSSRPGRARWLRRARRPARAVAGAAPRGRAPRRRALALAALAGLCAGAGGAAAAQPPLRRQRALARAGHALLLAGDGAREERQRDLHRARPASGRSWHVSPARYLRAPGARDVDPARPDLAAGAITSARLRQRGGHGRSRCAPRRACR